MDVIIIQRHGTRTEKTLTDVKVIPKLQNALFSLTKVMMTGWQLKGKWKKEELTVTLEK